ncbi:MAG TPA: four helix bundle protein [Flavobacteriales bacterium]|nr:four helix bundle protein [Flavobacteriales bacterium]
MNRINTYNELIIWQKSVELVTEVFKLAERIPVEGSCGLSYQMTKSAVAVPCNIAEGWGRENARSYAFFLKIARGAVMEIETCVQLCHTMHKIDSNWLDALRLKIAELNGMLSTIIKNTKNKSGKNF